MKTSEIADRVLEATQLSIIADLLLAEFTMVDTDILKGLASEVEKLVEEVALPVQEKIKEEV